jgi:hypothetical protein
VSQIPRNSPTLRFFAGTSPACTKVTRKSAGMEDDEEEEEEDSEEDEGGSEIGAITVGLYAAGGMYDRSQRFPTCPGTNGVPIRCWLSTRT